MISNLDVQIYNCYVRMDGEVRIFFKLKRKKKNIWEGKERIVSMPKICAYIPCEKNTNIPIAGNAIAHNILNEENSRYVCRNMWI